MFSNILQRFAQEAPVTDIPLDSSTNVQTSLQMNEAEVEAAGGILAGIGTGIIVINLIVALLLLVCSAKVFQKAGQAWWKALIPIYNTYVQLKIVGRPGWWLLLFFIPFVNIVVAIIVTHDLSKSFGKGAATTLLLLFLPIIMYPLMAFGEDYKYVGPAADPNFDPNKGGPGSAPGSQGNFNSSPTNQSQPISPSSIPGSTPASAAGGSIAAAPSMSSVEPTVSSPEPTPVTPPTVEPAPPEPAIAAAPENPIQVPEPPIQPPLEPVQPPEPPATPQDIPVVPPAGDTSPQNENGPTTPQPPQSPLA